MLLTVTVPFQVHENMQPCDIALLDNTPDDGVVLTFCRFMFNITMKAISNFPSRNNVRMLLSIFLMSGAWVGQ